MKSYRVMLRHQMALNIDPTPPELGIVRPPLKSMHGLLGVPGDCNCKLLARSTVRINHYLGSLGDFVDKRRRYWKVNGFYVKRRNADAVSVPLAVRLCAG